MADTSSAFPFGWEVDSGALVPSEGRRQDWRLTSSGVGLNYSPSLPFPPPYARVSKLIFSRIAGAIRTVCNH